MINAHENNTSGYTNKLTDIENAGQLVDDNKEPTTPENSFRDKSFKDVNTLNDAGKNDFKDENPLTTQYFKATGESPEDDDDDLLTEEDENDTDITQDEADALDNAGDDDDDEANVKGAQLDDTDDDGDLLDENDDFSGDDLDVPGAELDDDDEMIGNEDEENNNYSSNKQED